MVAPLSTNAIAALKSVIPRPLRPVARAFYYAAHRRFLRLDWWIRDRLGGLSNRAEVLLPPAKLRFRVGETSDASSFLSVGRLTAENLQAALSHTGFSLAPGQVALDFGCGCGRTLLWLTRRFPEVVWHGTDIDPEAIRWCRQAMPHASFIVNGPLPPLPHAGSAFDLVYGVSVFTHLSEEYQQAWIPELRRILKPGGLLLLSFHSEHVWKASEAAAAVERNEFIFRTSSKLKGIVPDWYQTAFQSQDRIVSMLSGHFAVLDYLPRGFGDQDAVIARASTSG